MRAIPSNNATGVLQLCFQEKIYKGIKELQADLDAWIDEYNKDRTHSGKYCYGKTPMQTFQETTYLAKSKQIDEIYHQERRKELKNKAPGNVPTEDGSDKVPIVR